MGTFFKTKAITSILLFFFAFSSAVYSQQASTVSDAVPSVGQEARTSSLNVGQVDPSRALIRPDLNPYNFNIPEEFGNIEEVFQGSSTSPLIVYIQNVHANYEAQVNIKKILAHLVERYQFNLIQLEGAVSKLNPEVLQPSYLREANLKLVDFLMREGRITGADAFSVETDKPVELYGIEDYGFYAENLKMFKSVYKHQPEVSAYFNEVHRLIQNIGPKLLSPELLDFTRKTEEFATDKIDFFDYMLYMNQLSEKHGLASLGDLKEMVNYPNLVRIMRLHNLEKQLNKKGLKNEVASIKAEFEKRMPGSKEVEEVMTKLEQNEKGTAPREYFLKLTQLADEAKIDFISYPALRIFAEFLIHQDEVDHRGLFQELKQFESMLQEELFTKDDEKALLEIIGFVGLLEQYFRLEMSREKLILYLKSRDQIKPSWIADELTKLAEKYQIVPKTFGDLAELDAYMGEVEYFYQLVLKRDEIFLQKVFAQMKASRQDKTVLITGGFHKDGLIDHFRKEKISYVIVNPKVNVKEGNENYLKVMLEEDAVVGSVFAGTFAIDTANPQNPGEEPNLFALQTGGVAFSFNLAPSEQLLGSLIQQHNVRFGEIKKSSRVSAQISLKEASRSPYSARFLVEASLPRGENAVRQGREVTLDKNGFQSRLVYEREILRRELEREIGTTPARLIASPVNRAELRDFQFLIKAPAQTTVSTTEPTTPLPQAVADSVLVDNVIVKDVPQFPPDIALGLLGLQEKGNPRVAKSLREALVQRPEAGELEVQAIVQNVSSEGRVNLTDEAINQVTEGNTERTAGVKFIDGQIKVVEPRLFVLMFEKDLQAEVKESILSALGEVLGNPNAMAFIVGENVSGYAALLTDDVRGRVKFFDVESNTKAVNVIVNGLRGKFFNFYRDTVPKSLPFRDLQKTPYTRPLVFPTESGSELSRLLEGIYGLARVEVLSKVGTGEVKEAGLTNSDVVRAEVRLLNIIPTAEDAVTYFGKLGLSGFFNRITATRWSLGLLSHIKQLLADRAAAIRFSVAA